MKIVVLIFLAVFVLQAQEKVRILISDSASWETSGGFVATRSGGGGGSSGGARPQTVEVMKTFSERCKSVQVTSDRSKAEYIVLFDKEGGKGAISKDSKIAVFERGGDMVLAKSARTVGGAVKEACAAINARLEKTK